MNNELYLFLSIAPSPACDDATTCNGNGACQGDGSCMCDAGFTGDDCLSMASTHIHDLL